MKTPKQLETAKTKELNKIKALFENKIDTDLFELNINLMENTARLKVLLQEQWQDIKENGTYDWFQQGEAPAYERERPVSKQYQTNLKLYQGYIKQLMDLLPKNVIKEEDTMSIEALFGGQNNVKK